MPIRFGSVLGLVGWALSLPLLSAATQDQTTTIKQLVAQLGSGKYAQREAASKALDKLGAASLPALQTAAQSSDAEVRSRASRLLERIRDRIETARLLGGKQVRLVFKDTPVLDAVAQLKKQTGYDIQIIGEGTGLLGRRITLDTGDTTFWKALEQFCRKAGLAEKRPSSTNSPSGELILFDGKGRIVEMSPRALSGLSPLFHDPRLFLADAKAPSLPTHHAGAIRIQALPPAKFPAGKGPPGEKPINLNQVNLEDLLHERGPKPGEVSINLDVLPEPSLSWLGVWQMRIDKAVDDKGQILKQPELYTQAEPSAQEPEMAILMEELAGTRMSRDPRKIPVRLKLAKQPSRILKELSGTLTIRVLMPQPLITVDNILNASGKPFKSRDGTRLKIVEVKEEKDGNVEIRVQVEGEQVLGSDWRLGRVVRRKGFVSIETTPMANSSTFSLLDSKGNSYSLKKTSWAPVMDGNGKVQEERLIFQPQKGQGKASQLVFTNPRAVALEIPFTLRDVPLP
jgi:hypothetical protein